MADLLVVEEAVRSRQKTPTDLHLLKDVPNWLRTLRLHKYTDNLKDMKWQDLVQLDDEGLEKRGVAAKGARSKLLKVRSAFLSAPHRCLGLDANGFLRCSSKSEKRKRKVDTDSSTSATTISLLCLQLRQAFATAARIFGDMREIFPRPN